MNKMRRVGPPGIPRQLFTRKGLPADYLSRRWLRGRTGGLTSGRRWCRWVGGTEGWVTMSPGPRAGAQRQSWRPRSRTSRRRGVGCSASPGRCPRLAGGGTGGTLTVLSASSVLPGTAAAPEVSEAAD